MKKPRRRTGHTPSRDGSPAEKQEVELSPDATTRAAGHDDPTLGKLLLLGTASTIAATRNAKGASDQMLVDVASSILGGIEPKNPIEALLASQMCSCHTMATDLTQRTLTTGDREMLALYGKLASQLMKTFVAQVEALGRLRGQSSRQTVRVEHVTVEPGAHAVVGAVQAPSSSAQEGG